MMMREIFKKEKDFHFARDPDFAKCHVVQGARTPLATTVRADVCHTQGTRGALHQLALSDAHILRCRVFHLEFNM